MEYGKIFDYARKKREECDYTAKVVIDRETAEKIVADAGRFIARIKKHLKTIGG